MARRTTLEPIPAATRVVVVANYGRDSLPPITDPAQIERLLTFINARASNWDEPWYGVPVPRIRVTIYAGPGDRAPAAYFGAGPNFFEAIRGVYFGSRAATRAEIAEFLAIVGAPADAAARPD